MIDAWDVYWVMQLDSILAFLQAGTVVFFIAAVPTLVFGFVFSTADPDEWTTEQYKAAATKDLQRAKPLKRVGFALTLLGVVFGFLVAFVPSSKTAAAMMVLPALTSDQVMEPVTVEARELYTLAKQALQNVATKKPEPVAEKQP